MKNTDKIKITQVHSTDLKKGMVLINIGKIDRVVLYKDRVVVKVIYNQEIVFTPTEYLLVDSNAGKYKSHEEESGLSAQDKKVMDEFDKQFKEDLDEERLIRKDVGSLGYLLTHTNIDIEGDELEIIYTEDGGAYIDTKRWNYIWLDQVVLGETLNSISLVEEIARERFDQTGN